MNHPVPLPRRLLAEFTGTALLVTVVVGSGIAAQQLSPDDVGLQLLENSTATVFGLAVLILLFGPVSGAHFNPVVSAADWLLGRRAGTGISASHVASYTVAQITRRRRRRGAGQHHVRPASVRDRHQGPHHHRPSRRRGRRHRRTDRADLRPGPHRASGTFRRRGRRLHRRGLLVHQLNIVRQPRRHRRPDVLRHLRRHRPGSAPGFIVAQIVGALIGLALIAALYPDAAATADDVVVPHHLTAPPPMLDTEHRSSP